MDFKIGKKAGNISFHHQRTQRPDSAAFERHCHSRCELLHILQGKGKFVAESAEYPLREGMTMLLRPHEYHYVQPDSDTPYERIVISFYPQDLDEAVGSLPTLQGQEGSAGLCFLPEGPALQASAGLASLDFCSRLPQECTAPLLRAVLEQALLLLSLAEPSVAAQSDPLMEKVMQYLTDHLTQPITLDGLSREFFLSKSHLCRAFRKHAGVTLLDYITAKRIAAARAWMHQGLPAIEAARQAGFSEYSTFYRAYRKHTGQSPSTGLRKRG